MAQEFNLELKEPIFPHLAFLLSGKAYFKFIEVKGNKEDFVRLYIYFYAQIDHLTVKTLIDLFKPIAQEIIFTTVRTDEFLTIPVMAMCVDFDVYYKIDPNNGQKP